MAKGYSTDLRARAVALVEDGESRREAARVLGLGASTAIRWIERWVTTGSGAVLKFGPKNNESNSTWGTPNIAESCRAIVVFPEPVRPMINIRLHPASETDGSRRDVSSV